MKAWNIHRGLYLVCCAAALIACTPNLPPAPGREATQSFGEKFFTISCERVAYTSSIAAYERALAEGI